MKGFPKHLNSRADYEYIRANFPREKWLQYWKDLLKDRYASYNVGELKSKADGIEDATHRIVECTEKDMETQKDVTKYYQFETRENPASDFMRLHFTEEEVKKAIA